MKLHILHCDIAIEKYIPTRIDIHPANIIQTTQRRKIMLILRNFLIILFDDEYKTNIKYFTAVSSISVDQLQTYNLTYYKDKSG